MRVLVTGSRDWPDRHAVWNALDKLQGEHGYIELVHGGCPTGADAAADDWARFRKVTPQVFRANWELYGKAASKRRNEEMLKDGAGVVLAFIRNECHEARDVIQLAHVADIPILTEVINDVRR